jgi:hypothetical protein
MGQPVAGNPTQFMMERAFEAAGLDWRYLTLEVAPEHLAAAVQGMKAMGFRGGNFTIPHKIAVIPYLDGLSSAAELIGAVNCVHLEERGSCWARTPTEKASSNRCARSRTRLAKKSSCWAPAGPLGPSPSRSGWLGQPKSPS